MLEYAALALLIIMVLFIIYLVIYIHDIPYEIAKERGHPHQDAIHIAGWVSMFLMHSIWPFLWIWAYLYKPDGKFMQLELTGAGSAEQDAKIARLETQIINLTASIKAMQAAPVEKNLEESNNG
jgi:Protein of unknown function (DUF3302)